MLELHKGTHKFKGRGVILAHLTTDFTTEPHVKAG